MNSVVGPSSAYDLMGMFEIRAGGVYIDRSTPARPIRARYTYTPANGVLRLFTAAGSPNLTLRWTAPGDGGSAERLVELVSSRSRVGQICYRADDTHRPPAPAIPRPQASTCRATHQPDHDPFNKYSYPTHLGVNAVTEGLPDDAVFVFRITPMNGCAPMEMRRTVAQVRSSPEASYRVPLEQTATLLIPRPGRYRVEVDILVPGRAPMRALVGRWDPAPSEVVEWGPNDLYVQGERQLWVTLPE